MQRLKLFDPKLLGLIREFIHIDISRFIALLNNYDGTLVDIKVYRDIDENGLEYFVDIKEEFVIDFWRNLDYVFGDRLHFDVEYRNGLSVYYIEDL